MVLYKLKIKKSIKKRFVKIGINKVKCKFSGKNHLNTNKSGKKKRFLQKKKIISLTNFFLKKTNFF